MTIESMTNPDLSLSFESAALRALLEAAAFAAVDDLGFIRVTGDDRVRWLNGMATNSIQALEENQGCYSFFLNAQGRIQGDATCWLLRDSILLETTRTQVATLIAHLERFIIMDDVELADITSERLGLLLIGPQAPEILERLGLPTPPPLRMIHSTFETSPIDLAHQHSPLVERFELWSTADTIAKITNALKKMALSEAGSDALECLRLLEGTPLYGTDIRAKELPQETNQTRALHFAKGCYLGQEIVERIRSRGNVHRVLSAFTVTGPLPPAGTPLFVEDPGKAVGEITSAARISRPSGTLIPALGYVRREALEASNLQGKVLQYSGGVATPTTPQHPKHG